jgi:ABC-type Zn uptake system ZnuABC Zn-binding protein ZnuA
VTAPTRCRLALVSTVVVLGGCGSDGGGVDPAPPVEVPNEVLADLVERVACVEPASVTVAGTGGAGGGDGRAPVLVVTLDESSAPGPDGTLTVSVPSVATTIDRPGPDDPWVWLDPIRFAETAQGVAGALASTGEFDPALLDRCVARIEAQMTALDEELFDATQTIADDERSIDVSAPGTLYFANRYEFLIDESDTAVRAGEIISSDTLSGAASYDEMMRANVDEVVALLTTTD